MKKHHLPKAAGLVVICLSCSRITSVGAVFTLTSPNEIINPTTVTFDGYPDLTVANNLFQSQGVTFSRDDGQAVFTGDWTALGRSTVSAPSVLWTVADFHLTTSWATHLNAQFSNPLYAIGAYFGNDQGDLDYAFTRLSVYGLSSQLLASVQISVNNNTSVDQFIGIQSDTPFSSVRFENFNTSGLPSTSYSVVIDNLSFSTVPEPTTLSFLGLTFSVLLYWRNRKGNFRSNNPCHSHMGSHRRRH